MIPEILKFERKAEEAFDLELLKHPDLPEQAYDYVYENGFLKVVLRRRNQELKAAQERIEFLEAQLATQGVRARERGTWLVSVIETTAARFGVVTLPRVDAVRLLQEEAPKGIRIKRDARNPYKLAQDAFNFALAEAVKRGLDIRLEHSKFCEHSKICRTLVCLRYYLSAAARKARTQLATQGELRADPRPFADWYANRLIQLARDKDPHPGG